MRRASLLCLITSVLAFSVVGHAKDKVDSDELIKAYHAVDIGFVTGAVPARVSNLKMLIREGESWNCKSLVKNEIVLAAFGENVEVLVEGRIAESNNTRMMTLKYDEAERVLHVKTEKNGIVGALFADLLKGDNFDFDNSQVLDGVPARLSHIKQGKTITKGRMMTFGADLESFTIKSIHIRPYRGRRVKAKNGGQLNEHDTQLIQCQVNTEA